MQPGRQLRHTPQQCKVQKHVCPNSRGVIAARKAIQASPRRCRNQETGAALNIDQAQATYPAECEGSKWVPLIRDAKGQAMGSTEVTNLARCFARDRLATYQLRRGPWALSGDAVHPGCAAGTWPEKGCGVRNGWDRHGKTEGAQPFGGRSQADYGARVP